MGHGNGRANEDYLKQQALSQQAAFNTALTKAETPDPLTQRLRDRVNNILNYDENVGAPKDVRNFPDQAAMGLYTDAKAVTDAGRVGKGYGTLAEGANPAFATALDKENSLKRGEFASGMLEDYVDKSITGATGEAASLGAQGDATSMAIAQILNGDSQSAQNRYLQYLTRPRQPSFLKQLALGGLSIFGGDLGKLFAGAGGGSSTAPGIVSGDFGGGG